MTSPKRTDRKALENLLGGLVPGQLFHHLGTVSCHLEYLAERMLQQTRVLQKKWKVRRLTTIMEPLEDAVTSARLARESYNAFVAISELPTIDRLRQAIKDLDLAADRYCRARNRVIVLCRDRDEIQWLKKHHRLRPRPLGARRPPKKGTT